MKIVCAFLVCFLAVTLADARELDVAKITAGLTECRKELGLETNINDENFRTVLRRFDDDISDDKKPCFAFCFFKSQGVMNENGTVDMTAILAATDEDERAQKRMTEVIEICQNRNVYIDNCAVAKCIRDKAEQIRIAV